MVVYAWVLQGFEAEVFTKYGTDGGDVVYARFQSTFLALPLASVVDGKVLVVHGGLSDEKRAGIQTMRRIHVRDVLCLAVRLHVCRCALQSV